LLVVVQVELQLLEAVVLVDLELMLQVLLKVVRVEH
jgi:hypothetical protein